jgi:hypothetical protein
VSNIPAHASGSFGYSSIIRGGQQHFRSGMEEFVDKGGADTDDGFWHAAKVIAKTYSSFFFTIKYQSFSRAKYP